jgi:hypothetical protein
MRSIFALGLLTTITAAMAQPQESAIALAPIKYDGLKQEVLKQRGKVVIVDFWAGY